MDAKCVWHIPLEAAPWPSLGFMREAVMAVQSEK